MTDPSPTPAFSLRQRYSHWRFRQQLRLARLRRGLLYGVGRLSKEDARRLFIDSQDMAGWRSLLSLADEDVLDEALEVYEHHPALPRLVRDACAQVAYKWVPYCDEHHEARRWALELVDSYARDENIALRLRQSDDDQPTTNQGAIA